jgi:hypothetical protein
MMNKQLKTWFPTKELFLTITFIQLMEELLVHNLGISITQLKPVEQKNLTKSIYKLACCCLNYMIKIK